MAELGVQRRKQGEYVMCRRAFPPPWCTMQVPKQTWMGGTAACRAPGAGGSS